MSNLAVCSKKACTDACYLCGGEAKASVNPYACSNCKQQWKQTCLSCKSRRSGSSVGRLCYKFRVSSFCSVFCCRRVCTHTPFRTVDILAERIWKMKREQKEECVKCNRASNHLLSSALPFSISSFFVGPCPLAPQSAPSACPCPSDCSPYPTLPPPDNEFNGWRDERGESLVVVDAIVEELWFAGGIDDDNKFTVSGDFPHYQRGATTAICGRAAKTGNGAESV
ncbi:hypothetical protein BLNAU_11735 [Blattamonas nauphoetae]|uniref:Uncharacterized protein n=1 Tax=Blattamonas nauphoetae TaxID=2049346 RepID=A0ABQ9XLG5_9EUKA|nr:hypothetical protein BLNAU_11735 [Blattamonas nauphoetae]